MAAVSLSPTPVVLSTMSSRRVPLSSNPNVANSPLRGATALNNAMAAKSRRSHASTQREDNYGQPPPAKRQMLEGGTKAVLRSPSRQPQQQLQRAVPSRATSRSHAPSRRHVQDPNPQPTEEDLREIRKWQQNQRSRFPKFVFYFDGIPQEQQSRLAKQLTHLGARRETFFDKTITHVVTTREIPNERPKEEPAEPTDAEAEQPQTINPSLLSRSAAVSGPSVASRRSVFENAGARRMSIAVQEDPIRRLKPSRNVDVLHRALDMGKKIWSLNKLQRVLEILLESDPYRSFAMTRASHVGAANQNAAVSRAVEDPSLLQQMLDKERANGPTDRDLRVATQEIHYFKGHYIYVYDVEGKQKPMIIREFPKAAEKHDGDWPQLRASGSGRCPFVEDADAAEKRSVEKARRAAAAAAADKAPKLQPPEAPAPKPVTGKRTLGEMQDGQNQRAGPRARVDLFDATKAAMMPVMDFQNAFTGRAKTGRFFAGEPGASGVQPSGITSAIRSQMISSATGGLGARAGTSKAIHGLQRQVLQRSTSTGLQEPSSRRMTEVSMDHPNFVRSTSIGTTSRRKLDMIDEDQTAPEQKHKRTVSVPAPPPKKKREAKPGYCENCQEKFDDFDEHILSRKHRRFADDDNNWTELDALLEQLVREPKFP